MKTFNKVLMLIACLLMLVACSGQKKESIVIGGSGPTSGGAAIYGTDVKNGAQLAVDEINAKEGKEYFVLDFQDDKHDTEQAVNAYGTLKDHGMQVSILCTTSAPCNAVADMYQEDDIFAITPSGSNAAIPAHGDNIFQMCFTDPNQGVAGADFISSHPELGTTVGVLYQDSTDYSIGIFEKFKSQAAARGMNIVEVQSFGDGEKEFGPYLDKLKAAGCDVVFLPIYYEEAALILKQAKDKDYAPSWFGVDGMDGVLGVEGFDPSLAEGVYLLYPFTTESSTLAAEFSKNYEAKYGFVPTQFGADAYDCVYAIYQACKDGNVTYDMSAKDIAAVLRTQFTTMTYNGVTGQNVTWAKSGEVSKAPLAIKIVNGEYVDAN